MSTEQSEEVAEAVLREGLPHVPKSLKARRPAGPPLTALARHLLPSQLASKAHWAPSAEQPGRQTQAASSS